MSDSSVLNEDSNVLRSPTLRKATPGWQRKTIGELCEIVNGGTPKTDIAKFWDGEHLWITPAEMGGRPTPYIDDTRRKLTSVGLNSCSARLLPANSVILSSRAPIGHLVINVLPMATNQGCKGLVPSKLIDHKYLYYFLLSSVDLLNSLGTGTTFKELSGSRLKEVLIPFPHFPEQRRIVGILDQAFEGIATARANAEASLEALQRLFALQLSVSFQNLSESARKAELQDVLAVMPQNGWSPPLELQAASGTPILTLSSVTGFKFRADKIKFTMAVVDPTKRYWVRNGDFLITRSNTPELVGHVAIAEGLETPTLYPDLIMKMVPDSKLVTTEYLYYQLRSRRLREEIMGRAQGANPTMKKLDNLAVRTLPVLMTDLARQKLVTATLREIEDSIEQSGAHYRRKLAALDELKQSLLHQAFTGQL